MSAKDERMNARSEADLIKLARLRGYKNPEWWAKKIIEGRAKAARKLRLVTVGGKRA